ADVAFARSEDRPAYMQPGRIDLRLTLTNTQGDQVTVAPYSFTARPQHHYIVTMGVKEQAESGEALLDVQITEEVENEFIEIPLGDELFSAPAPALVTEEFPADMKYEEFEGFALTNDPRVNLLAYGGMKSLNLSVKSAGDVRKFQLVGADASVQHELEELGIEAIGFFNNPDQMGVVKFGRFLTSLPEGSYSVKLDAVDKRGIVSNEVTFEVTIKNVRLAMEIVDHAEYMSDKMTVKVTSNQQLSADKLRFEALDSKDNWQEARVVSDAARATRADGEYIYTYKLIIPAPESTETRVRVFYGSSDVEKASVTDNAVVFPEYTVETDAFANKVYFKIIPADPSRLKVVADNFKLTDANNTEYPNLVKVSEQEGIYMLSQGITPATSYDGFESCLSFTQNPHKKIAAFTTEPTSDISNGDFSTVSETLNYSNIQVGGQWKVSPVTYANTSSIVRSTPSGWASVNDLTCWKDSKNKNTWFMVPSTYSENGEVVIESVGYNHDGKTPATSGGSGNTKYYCENVPADGDLVKASGELFLGSYTFDGNEKRVDGIEWKTRPSSLSFDYKYTPVGNEQGEAYIRVLDATGNEIASSVYPVSATTNGKAQINIEGYPFGKKAARLELCFRSTKRGVTPKVIIPTGTELKEAGIEWNNFTNKDKRRLDANTYHSVAKGSMLTIDNVKLGYSDNSADRAKRKGVKKVAKRK
ncbi:MAG: hypothetical protein K2J70_01705, partial [Muribaculaceae bacterium]|nr:hypothetical protein [Muribaculaceae bacterium]